MGIVCPCITQYRYISSDIAAVAATTTTTTTTTTTVAAAGASLYLCYRHFKCVYFKIPLVHYYDF